MTVKRTTRKKRPPRATVKTKAHPPQNKAIIGSEERLATFSARAMQLRINGLTLRETGAEIAKEFNLDSVPVPSTVQVWVDKAFREGLAEQKDEAIRYVELTKGRAERMIKELIPFAVGPFAVQRTKMIDGELTTIIDENVLKERIAACAEIRKQGETVLRAMGVVKERLGDVSTGGQASTMAFLIQTINNHIQAPGEKVVKDRKHQVLELTSGDPIIDGM